MEILNKQTQNKTVFEKGNIFSSFCPYVLGVERGGMRNSNS